MGPPRVLATCDYFLPGFRGGGPIRSLAALSRLLEPDLHFHFWTADRDLGDQEPYPENERKRVESENYRVRYFSPEQRTLLQYEESLAGTEYRAIFLNSLFSPRFTLPFLRLRQKGLLPAKRVVLAPRGECSPAALGHKALKKKIWLKIAALFNFYSDIHWLASSEEERRQIETFLTKFNIEPLSVRVLAEPTPLLLETRNPVSYPEKPAGRLRLVFLARIHPIKNLDFVLSTLARVEKPVSLDIFGPEIPGTEDYRIRCLSLSRELQGRHEVRFHGEVPAEKVVDTLREYDLFFLPSQSENFGHGILEAMAAGLPVLTSDQTPWRHLDRRQAGWDLPLEQPGEFVKVIVAAREDDSSQWQEKRKSAFSYAQEYLARCFQRDAHLKLFLGEG